MSKLADYLISEESQLHEAALQAGIIKHNATIGKNREDILAEFLRKHIPTRLSLFSNARVFSLDDEESKEIDLLVINDISINFLNKLHMFTNVESVAAAITVKSYLDKAALYDCLENLASIPQMNNEVLKITNLFVSQYEAFIENYPTLFVFAFDGIRADLLEKYISDFYVANPKIPYNRRPKAIIVNRQCLIEKAGDKSETFNGQKNEKGTYIAGTTDVIFKGYPLAVMIRDIAEYVGWLSVMNVNFFHYFNRHFGGGK
ncbi:MAG: hypothetical protein LLF96_05390 [Eubacteriales bacterium]|nr:hypothetical protein [Eubacteriales bacterium]